MDLLRPSDFHIAQQPLVETQAKLMFICRQATAYEPLISSAYPLLTRAFAMTVNSLMPPPFSSSFYAICNTQVISSFFLLIQ